MQRVLTLATVVLAAGAGSRFGTDPAAKLTAPLEGRPLLAHVLEQVRATGPAATVVVLGAGARDIERALNWVDELRIVNHAPERGLASSLQLGIDTLRAMPEPFDGALLVLGDQPRLRAETMRTLERVAARARPGDRPVLVPRYEEPGPRNPVLLLRPAWSWIDELEADDGLAPLIKARPDFIQEVQVTGRMPDVDTPADLAALERA